MSRHSALLSVAAMLSKNRSHMLKRFDEAADELRLFLRAGHPLSEAEQLFIENRLMMLRMGYGLWANDKSKDRHKEMSTDASKEDTPGEGSMQSLPREPFQQKPPS